MSPELKSDVAELHVPLPGSAALPDLSSVGNPCDSTDLGPSGDAPAWREATFSSLWLTVKFRSSIRLTSPLVLYSLCSFLFPMRMLFMLA